MGTLFQRWMCFDQVNKCTAMRFFQSSNVVHLKNGKCTLSKIRFLMKRVEDKAKELPEWRNMGTGVVSAEVAKAMFDKVFNSVIEPVKNSSEKRQWAQASWTTVEKWLKEHERELSGPKWTRKRRNQNADDESFFTA